MGPLAEGTSHYTQWTGLAENVEKVVSGTWDPSKVRRWQLNAIGVWDFQQEDLLHSREGGSTLNSPASLCDLRIAPDPLCASISLSIK